MFVFINCTRASFVVGAREGGRKLLACFAPQSAVFGVLQRALWPFLLLLRLFVQGCVALLSQAFADLLARSGVWRPAECFAAHCSAMPGCAEHMWPVCCQACVYDGRSVIIRIVPRAGARVSEPKIGCSEEYCVYVCLC